MKNQSNPQHKDIITNQMIIWMSNNVPKILSIPTDCVTGPFNLILHARVLVVHTYVWVLFSCLSRTISMVYRQPRSSRSNRVEQKSPNVIKHLIPKQVRSSKLSKRGDSIQNVALFRFRAKVIHLTQSPITTSISTNPSATIDDTNTLAYELSYKCQRIIHGSREPANTCKWKRYLIDQCN